MKFESPMLVVADINKSVQSYKELLGLEVFWILEQIKH